MIDDKGSSILGVLVVVTIVVIAAVLAGGLGFHFGKSSKTKDKSGVENDIAEKKEDERYLTIVNKTGQVINEVHITVGEGTEINAAHKENPKEDSFSVKIPKEYTEYDVFGVILEDRYGFLYEKEISDVKKAGRTEVPITKKDKVKRKGDWKRKIDQFFNGD